MSIWFMRDNHTFVRLDGRPVDEVMDQLETVVDQEGGYGLVGCKEEHGAEIFQWNKGQPWRARVHKILTEAQKCRRSE
jgi:hypothetical protein